MADPTVETIKLLKEELGDLRGEVSDIGSSLKDAFRNGDVEAKALGRTLQTSLGTFNKIDSILSNTSEVLSQVAKKEISRKDLAKELAKLGKVQTQIEDEILKVQRNKVNATGESLNLATELEAELTSQLQILKDQEDKIKDITKNYKGQSDIVDRLKKKYDSLTTNFTLAAIWKQVLAFTLAADEQVTELAKSLGLSKDQARGIRDNFAQYAKSTGDNFVTTKKLMEAQSGLTSELGAAVEYTGKQADDFSRLTKLIGLSAGEAGKLARLSVINGKSIEDTTKSIIKGSFASERSKRISVDQRTILKDVANLSEGILVKFQGNPEALGAAVVQAKALGLNLEQVDKIGESLLNFESSIENELKAELITGKKINLEKARAAALTGDQATLMEEVASQTGSLNEYSNMNIIAQKSLAEAFGMSRDEMSKMLMDQEKFTKLGDVSNMTLDKQLENLKAQGEPIDSVLYKQIQQQSTQEKYNNAIEKLQEIIGNLVAGPLGKMLDMVVGLADHASVLYGIFGLIAGISLVKTIGSLAIMAAELAASSIGAITLSSALTFGLGTIAILGAIGAIVGMMQSSTKEVQSSTKFAKGGIVTSEINNATIGEAGPEAIIPLNSSKASSILGGGMDITPMIAAINEVRNAVNALANKSGDVHLDGQKVGKSLGAVNALGTSQNQNSYRLA